MAAVRKENGEITDQGFKTIATALFKYLEGEPKSHERLVVTFGREDYDSTNEQMTGRVHLFA